jgi:predicted nucleic acid-binding protein
MTASKAVLVDSSGWIAATGTGPKAPNFQKYIAGSEPLIMPTIVIYEVLKKLLLSAGKSVADRFVSHALRQTVVPLDDLLAQQAAELSLRHSLPMADAIIYATAQARDAEVITSDVHFQDLPGVTLI